MIFTSYVKLARLHRPIGIWLLMFPAWWGLALASPTWPPLFLLILFACGAIIMRSAGCVYNDMVDKEFDIKVKRTAIRPLPAGDISLKKALLFLFLLLGGGATILFSLPLPVILVGFFALILILLYPWMKRITYWPQLFLGFTFNTGLLMGWLSLNPTLTILPFLFYGGAIFWTLGYDTIYAFQDREDDLFAGVKSSALAISSSPKLFLSLVYGTTLLLWGIGGREAHLNWIYWFFLSLIALHMGWQIISLREENQNNCLKRFESNASIGIILFLSIVFSHLID
ncbi:MAG: 4-hydroxybenzoate octaprenyltransferase [Proteobacteria bacterium]|nr:4-hydroxybenzoate octaprenyltransferase [Pseudomonadota bacterium]